MTPAQAIPSSPSVADLATQARALADRLAELEADAAPLLADAATPDRLDVFHGYFWVGVVAFLVTLCATPIMRCLAISNGVVDHPSDPRKVHRVPVAYLGGVAVFLGLLAGILFSYVATTQPHLIDFHQTSHLNRDFMHAPVPLSILFGLTIIMLVGLLDDVVGIPPWQKIGGQLFAAAALAYDDVGIKVAAGVVLPLANAVGIEPTAVPGGDLQTLGFVVHWPAWLPLVGGGQVFFDVLYWIGTGVIALCVLGACNASNLIDGLDGLLSGTTAIAAAGLLVVALGLAVSDDGPRDAQRVVLCLALLGACLGFLPHNFNPANIFLGDCGSLLLGFTTIVVILTLGDTGKTHLVFAGLFIYAIPIMDTVLAIIRRKLSGQSISAADDQHLHHMLRRALGVRGAVLALYAIGAGCAVIGVAMTLGRARIAYAVALVFASFIVVTAIKIARRAALEERAATAVPRKAPNAQPARPAPRPKPAPAGEPSTANESA